MQRIILIIIILILVWWGTTTINRSTYEAYLYGLWAADEEFCEEAGISSMMVFIGDKGRDGSRLGYIVIQSDDCTTHQGFVLKYSKGNGGPIIGPYVITGTVDFDDEPLWTEDGKIKMTCNIQQGSLRIYYAGKLYARLYKNHTLSNSF